LRLVKLLKQGKVVALQLLEVLLLLIELQGSGTG
jgi:hypothetical protein